MKRRFQAWTKWTQVCWGLKAEEKLQFRLLLLLNITHSLITMMNLLVVFMVVCHVFYFNCCILICGVHFVVKHFVIFI